MRFEDERPKTSADDSSEVFAYGVPPAARPMIFATASTALLGALFAGVATADFVEHLDRQVHSIHCSFVPGAGAQLGESGCRTVMMSPYSSLFRSAMWGGLPISLLGLAVFSYLVYRAVDFGLRERLTQRETMFLVVASLLPVSMSLIYGTISILKLDALCKLCAGIYASSLFTLIFAWAAHRRAEVPKAFAPRGGLYARWFFEGVAYVAVLVFAYLVFAPRSPKTVEGCGALAKSDDASGVLLSLEGAKDGAPSIAVLDPLCPACKAFEQRLSTSGLLNDLNVRAVLFPLDASCNWMLKRSLHPGACAVSEAMLCDKDEAKKILGFAFSHQEELKSAAERGDASVRERIVEEFPKLKGCLGSPAARARVNKSLRWAVANALPVLTPQLFIGDRRVCDEDTDLGLEYTIHAMLEKRGTKRAGRSP